MPGAIDESRTVNRASLGGRQRGWLSFEAMMAIVLIMTILPVAQTWYTRVQLDNRTEFAAQHLERVETALENYVKANWALLEGAATNTDAATVTLGDLTGGGFLPAGFSLENPYGQTYQLRVVEPNPNTLVAVAVGTGGRPSATGTLEGSELSLATEVIPETATKLGITGGVVPYEDMPGRVPEVIEGANGSWTYDYSGISGLNNIGVIHGALASVNFFLSGVVNNDYLYRSDIGIPELNRMETNLDMNGNDIENVGSLTGMTGSIATTGDNLTNGNAFEADQGDIELKDGTVKAGDVIIDDVMVDGGATAASLSRAVYDMRVVSPNTVIDKPVCPAPSVARIFVSVDAAPVGGSDSGGMSIDTTAGTVTGQVTSFRSRAVDNGSGWQVMLEVYMINATSPDGWYTLASSGGAQWAGSLMVGTKCN